MRTQNTFNPVVLLGLLVSKTKGYSLPTFKSDKIFSGTYFANCKNKNGGIISFSLTLAAINLQSKRVVNSLAEMVSFRLLKHRLNILFFETFYCC